MDRDACRQLELIFVSGRDIGPGSSTGRPEAYAEVSLRLLPGVVHKSIVDREGGTSPTWNLALTLTMQDSYVWEPGVEVVVKLYYERIEGDMFVGEVEIPIPVLFDLGIKGSAAFDVVPTGTLTISYTFGELGLLPEYPSFPSLPILQLLPSAKLLSLKDSLLKEYLFEKKIEIFNPDRISEDSFSKLKEYTVGALESSSKGPSAIRKAMGKYNIRRSLESSSQDLRAKRKEMTECFLSSLESSSQDLRAKRKEMKDVAKSHYKRFLEDFILFCSVFPLDYKFTKDVLVWQWIARRWIEWEADEEMEEVCTEECINSLVDKNYIIPSGYDYVLDQTKYKIGDKMTTDGKYLDSKQSHHDPTNVELLSLTFKEIDHAKVGVLKQYSRLHTLVIHDCYEVDHLPSDLFSELKSLKILNLSRTNIVELPSSVEDLKELRFLDMSNTPLDWLPESICSLTQLQTLNFDGCVQLEGLPEGTSNLINLRHLVLDVVLQLESMPVGLGKLSNLRTLSAFLVGEEKGCSVAELKDINKLRGTFRLLNLENVKTKEEASKACMSKKVDLKKIELQWSDIEDEKIPHEEEILESLKPPVGIQELKILFYSGGLLPYWILDPSYEELVTISLYKCRYCVNLSSLGELPSLKHLSIIENKEVVEIDTSFGIIKNKEVVEIDTFFGRNERYRRAVFPKLEKLTFESMCRLERFIINLDIAFPSLRHLIIEYCPKLEKLQFLWFLRSLTHLEIRYCPELSLSLLDRLPLSLQSLMIKESPRLKEWCCSRDSSRIVHVATVFFDHQKFPPDM